MRSKLGRRRRVMSLQNSLLLLLLEAVLGDASRKLAMCSSSSY